MARRTRTAPVEDDQPLKEGADPAAADASAHRDPADPGPAAAQDTPDVEPDEDTDEDGNRFVPNEGEQADLDAVAAGHPNAAVLAAIEHAKGDDALDTDDPSRLPAEDGKPRYMSARVVDNAVVYVTIGDTAFVLTTDEATALAGAIGAIMVELVR